MKTYVNRRGVVGILLLFLVVVIVAGCAPLPQPETQQEVQTLREQVATLEARVEESQAAPATETQQEIQTLREQVTTLEARVEESQAVPAPTATPAAVSVDEMMARMTDLQQRMQAMMQQGTPARRSCSSTPRSQTRMWRTC